MKIVVNSKVLDAKDGETIFEVCSRYGIDIPVMCYLKGYPHFTSCMVCVVEDVKTGKLIPSCSCCVSEGMEIITDSEKVKKTRKASLEFLLSEHLGDCIAPCERACPAHMNIPEMIRKIAAGDFKSAINIVKMHIPLPAVLGRICPALCENACRRSKIDEAVSICNLKRFAGDFAIESCESYQQEVLPSTGKKIGVIGAGPAGLSVSFYLVRYGHSVDVYERYSYAGGQLRCDQLKTVLPEEIIEKEIAFIKRLGVKIFLGEEIDAEKFKEMIKEYDVVVLACGDIRNTDISSLDLEITSRGIKVNHQTRQTDLERVFAVGAIVSPTKLAVKSVGDGKRLAEIIDLYLKGEKTIVKEEFSSIMPRLTHEELQRMLVNAENKHERNKLEKGAAKGFTIEEAIIEAKRCLHCDCRKRRSCMLKNLAEIYMCSQKNYKILERREFKLINDHSEIIYEPGKCILCGRCVRITEAFKEELGLTFLKRGFNTEISPPLGSSLKEALVKSWKECVLSCPTGALSFRNNQK